MSVHRSQEWYCCWAKPSEVILSLDVDKLHFQKWCIPFQEIKLLRLFLSAGLSDWKRMFFVWSSNFWTDSSFIFFYFFFQQADSFSKYLVLQAIPVASILSSEAIIVVALDIFFANQFAKCFVTAWSDAFYDPFENKSNKISHFWFVKVYTFNLWW